MTSLARFLRERWALVVGPLVLLAVWELLSRTGVIPETFFPEPTRIIAGVTIIADAETGLGIDLMMTVFRLIVTVVLAVLIGVGIGIAITASQWTQRGISTVLRVRRRRSGVGSLASRPSSAAIRA